MSLCPAPTPYPLTSSLGMTSFFQPLLRTVGTRVYMLYQDQMNTYLTCYDFSNLAPYPCTGFTGPAMMWPGSPVSIYNLFFTYTTTMVPTHLCTSFYDQSMAPVICVDITTGQVITGLPSYVSASAVGVFNDYFSSPAVASSRSFFSVINQNLVRCWDWSTNAACGSLVPNSMANYYYELEVDPDGCIWGLSDNHISLNFDVNLNSPCQAAPHGIANPDFSLFNAALPCGTVVTGDVLANDANIFPSSLASLDVTAVATGSAPYELQWTPPHCPFTGEYTVPYRVCSNAWATSSVFSEWYIVVNPGPIVKPTISYNVVDFQSTTVMLSDWITAGVFPIDYSSFQVLTPVPPQIGWVVYDQATQQLSFLPNRNLDAPLSITTQICDDPGTIGTPPITIPRVCKTTVITFVPYYVHWVTPNLDPYTYWYMYWPAFIQWTCTLLTRSRNLSLSLSLSLTISHSLTHSRYLTGIRSFSHTHTANLPDDFQLQFALTKYPSGSYVTNFVLPLSEVNGNATWTPVRDAARKSPRW